MVTASSTSASLKEYLKRYETNTEQEKKKKKKKKKKEVKADATGVVVVDEDPVWQKPVNHEEEDDESTDEEKPQINEDIEVKRMKRLELLKSRRPFGVISEDGSGWVSVSETPRNPDFYDEVSDKSPPQRRIMRNDTPSPESKQKLSTTVDADFSPPRKQRTRNDTPSPGREWHPNKADVDLSPPRKQKTRSDSPSPEPALKLSGTSVGDLSPPRQQRKRKQPASPEPPTKVGIDSSQLQPDDVSPPRRRRAHYGTPSPHSDFETSKYSREAIDLSPPRRQQQRQLPPSQEPGASLAGDLSPPRKSRIDKSTLPSHPSEPTNEAAVSDLSPPRKIQKGTAVLKQRPKTGLVTGREVKEEISKIKREEYLRLIEMDPSSSGRGAEPVYRDKITGERMSKEEFLKTQKKQKEEKPKDIKLEWGKGLAQKREAEERMKELELEKEKPFARSRDDPELDKMMKERVRWGDPMAHLVKKKSLESILPDLGNNEKMKESGFIIPQEVPSHSWIRRGLGAPPNRYGIKPGRHWDGVDRSNGFEKEFFKRTNEKQATEREAYLWSVADM